MDEDGESLLGEFLPRAEGIPLELVGVRLQLPAVEHHVRLCEDRRVRPAGEDGASVRNADPQTLNTWCLSKKAHALGISMKLSVFEVFTERPFVHFARDGSSDT